MPFRSTEEEKAQKRAEREAKAKVAQAEQKAKAYAASPVGKAEAAYDRGDTFFEIQLEINANGGSGVSTSGGGFGLLAEAVSMAAKAVSESNRVNHSAALESKESTDVLGDIEQIGWNLEHAGYVYVQMRSTSSGDTDGYSTTFSGETVGIYLFRRATSQRTSGGEPHAGDAVQPNG